MESGTVSPNRGLSLRWRLFAAMLTVPLIGLGSVAVATRYTTGSHLGESVLKFEIQQVQVAGGGLRSPDGEEEDFPVFRSQIRLNETSQPIRFANAQGDVYSLEADRGFVTAFEDEQRAAIATVNRQVTIAAVAVAVLTAISAFWLSRHIVQPVRRLTGAANDLEAGNLGRRVEVESSDEIGVLARAFNSMAGSIERNENLRKQMTSDVAHELRSPLNNITGYLEAIADGVVEADPATITSLREEADLLVRLVADLEQISLADAGRQVLFTREVQFNTLVRNAVAMVGPRAANHGVTIVSEATTPIQVTGDPDRLSQVLRNLLENAITHTPNGGVIRVILSAVDDRAVLTVTDSGPGIPEEHLPFIFERFYRADASRTRATGGAGLGLAIVNQIVTAHGGSVGAGNAEGGGARFAVELPAKVEVAEPRHAGLLPTPVVHPS